MLSLNKQWPIVLFVVLIEMPALGEPVITTPFQFYGLGSLTCAAMSPDGRKVASAGNIGAFLWDLETSRGDQLIVSLDRRSHKPIIAQVARDGDPRPIPWLAGKRLRLTFK